MRRKSRSADGTRILRRCSFAVETAQGPGLPLLFTEQAPAKLGPTAPELLALVAKPVVLAKDEFSARIRFSNSHEFGYIARHG